jgi:hypothetical protein
MPSHPGIDVLLELHGQIIDQGGGYQLLADFFGDVDRVLGQVRE